MVATLLGPVAQAHAAAQVMVVDSPYFGRTLAVLEVPSHPLGVVVLLPGGDGRIGVAADGGVANGGNFLVRTRKEWIANGYGYLLVDAPQSGPGLLGARHTREYAAVVTAAVAGVKALGVPVVVVGTSQGSIGAANAAALLGKSVSGVILTSTVAAMGNSGETVFDAPLGDIAVPVLIVDNAGDRCPASPPAASDGIAAKLTAAPSVEKARFWSFAATGDRCGPFSPHGYLGIENAVFDRMQAWMRRWMPNN